MNLRTVSLNVQVLILAPIKNKTNLTRILERKAANKAAAQRSRALGCRSLKFTQRYFVLAQQAFVDPAALLTCWVLRIYPPQQTCFLFSSRHER